jgi:hypothetical protein
LWNGKPILAYLLDFGYYKLGNYKAKNLHFTEFIISRNDNMTTKENSIWTQPITLYN